jgi:hypothetical protein
MLLMLQMRHLAEAALVNIWMFRLWEKRKEHQAVTGQETRVPPRIKTQGGRAFQPYLTEPTQGLEKVHRLGLKCSPKLLCGRLGSQFRGKTLEKWLDHEGSDLVMD